MNKQFYFASCAVSSKLLRSIEKHYRVATGFNKHINYIAVNQNGQTVGYSECPIYYREHMGFNLPGEPEFPFPANMLCEWGNIPLHRRIFPVPEEYLSSDSFIG